MLNKMKDRIFAGIWIMLLAVHAQTTLADAHTPHEVVEEVTVKLVNTILEHQADFEEDPEPFYQALDSVLNEAIDFGWIAYNVMGPYRKEASVDQRQRFANKFRRDLIETYGGGLVTFGDQKIVVLPSQQDIEGKRAVRVDQEIHGEDGVYPLQYTMGLNRSGEWKVTNVIINGVNLGKTFRNQFLQRAQKLGGDIDKVIESWSASLDN